jgi:uncharacterized membrane protein YbhN (UPF0104 family)
VKIDKKPSFRKAPTPWYASDLFCVIFLIFGALVFYFSLTGISVALGHHQYRRYCWVPILLIFLSGVLVVTSLFRIVSRLLNRYGEEG